MPGTPIRLVVSYDGTDFGGWQRQKNARSVQEELESALAKMHGHPVPLTGAGRTDAGVHAMGQVAGFFTDIGSIPAEKFRLALNRLLPHDVRVLSASGAPDRFHARFDASLRRYRYFIMCGGTPDPFRLRFAHHLARVPRIGVLNAMAGLLHGEMDFAAFCSARDPSPSKTRFVTESTFFWDSGFLVYQVAANAFLYRMVRSLVGSMLHFEAEAADATGAAGRMSGALASGSRKSAGPTAPSRGLFLWNVEYGPRVHGMARASEWPGEDEPDADPSGAPAESTTPAEPPAPAEFTAPTESTAPAGQNPGRTDPVEIPTVPPAGAPERKPRLVPGLGYIDP